MAALCLSAAHFSTRKQVRLDCAAAVIDDDLGFLTRDWDFTPSRPTPSLRLRRLRERIVRAPAPLHTVLTPPTGTGPWTVYFVYAPEGQIAAAHRFTLDRLNALGKILVVCAAPSPAHIPHELAERADALIWKGLSGFDFSAYAIGLATIAKHVPGSDVLVLNDSVFGPLSDLRPWLSRARWDLTGFTATSNVENHIQSYVFLLRGVTPARMSALSAVLSTRWAYNRFWGVVLNQETQFARIASRSLSVGAFFYSDRPEAEDPTLQLALPLVRRGFPFLKRSLLGKLSHLHDQTQVCGLLEAAGHPV